jgi:CheY-like chemotaxis protein
VAEHTAGAGRHVLMVDDDPGDVALVEEFFLSHAPEVTLDVAEDGHRALALLRGEVDGDRIPPPSLILLDLNMPRMDGRAVLEVLKKDPALATIPVVIFTTSAAADDITRSYAAHANAYVTKPLNLESFEAVLSKINSFFGELARRPPR